MLMIKRALLLAAGLTTACTVAPKREVIDTSMTDKKLLELERRLVELESRMAMTEAHGWRPYSDVELETYLRCVAQKKTIECVNNGKRVKKANAKRALNMLSEASKGQMAEIIISYEYLNNYSLQDSQRDRFAKINELYEAEKCFISDQEKRNTRVFAKISDGQRRAIEQKVKTLSEEEADKIVGYPEAFFNVRRKLPHIFNEIVSMSDYAEEQVYVTSTYDIVCVEGDEKHKVRKFEIALNLSDIETYLFEYQQ